jgi:formylglycine-generating enzyme required for sulfatase activity
MTAIACVSPALAAQQGACLLDMVRVPGGTFLMGDSFGHGRSDERPLHPVTVHDFLLSRLEVTVGQFRQFVEDTGYRTSAERQGGWLVWTGTQWDRRFNASWRNPYFDQADDHPVVMVSWDDAVQFCNWLSRREGLAPVYRVDEVVTEDWSADGYRLPTEAEWEYAARSGGQAVEFAWGAGGPRGNVADTVLREAFPAWPFATWPDYRDGHVATAPVGSYPPNQLGLFDMSGNVWEWCNDWYVEYGAEPRVDPRGPASGTTRCLRGGSWSDEPASLRAAFRSGRLQNGRGVNSGFRPARSLP